MQEIVASPPNSEQPLSKENVKLQAELLKNSFGHCISLKAFGVSGYTKLFLSMPNKPGDPRDVGLIILRHN